MNRIYVRQPGPFKRYYRPQLPTSERFEFGRVVHFSDHTKIADIVVEAIQADTTIQQYIDHVSADEIELWVQININGLDHWDEIQQVVIRAFQETFLDADDPAPEIVHDGTTVLG